jgi:hypothetical protein
LKPGAFKLWVNLIQLVPPPPAVDTLGQVVVVRRAGSGGGARPSVRPAARTRRRRELRRRAVALQVAFERQTLKPVFHLIGYRLWVWKAIGYGLWVNLIQRAEPHRAARALAL